MAESIDEWGVGGRVVWIGLALMYQLVVVEGLRTFRGGRREGA